MYEEIVKEFQTQVDKLYNERRIDRTLAKERHIWNVKSKMTKLPKNRPTAQILTEGQKPTVFIPQYRNVTPLKASITLDIQKFVKELDRHIDVFSSHMAHAIAEGEARVIIKGLIDHSGKTITVKERGHLKSAAIKEASRWIGSHGLYADTVITNPKQWAELVKGRKILEPERIPSSWVPREERGPHYEGKIDGRDLYCFNLPEKVALVYRKEEVILAKTKLNVRFDNPERPANIIAERWCSSAPVLEEGVVKINL